MSHDVPPKTTRDLISEFMLGIALLIALLLVGGFTFGLGAATAYNNNQKVQKMTQYCVDKGYQGWDDTVGQTSRCTGGDN